MHKGHDRKTIERELTNYMGYFLKENIGRGPKDVEIKFMDNVFLVFIKGILFPMEKNILNTKEGKEAIEKVRKLYLANTNKERLSMYEKIIGAKVVDHYEGWNLELDSAIAVVVFDRNIF